MKCNLGKIDRTVRALLGLAVCVAGIILNKWLILMGGILLLTAVIGWCPIYLPFGISTKDKK